MGIPVYFKTLIEDYNNLCIPDTRKLNIDNLFFDLNCLIHPCCHGLTDENLMYEKIVESIHNIINIVQPQEMIYNLQCANLALNNIKNVEEKITIYLKRYLDLQNRYRAFYL